MATKRMNGEGFEKMQEVTSDSDTEGLGEFDSGKLEPKSNQKP